MTPSCRPGQATGRRSEYATAMFLRRIEREHAAAMYGWSHPHNIEIAAARATAHGNALRFDLEARR